MNPQEKIDLKKLIGNMGDYEDNTAGIREMKHSDSIRADIQKMVLLKQSKRWKLFGSFLKKKDLIFQMKEGQTEQGSSLTTTRPLCVSFFFHEIFKSIFSTHLSILNVLYLILAYLNVSYLPTH